MKKGTKIALVKMNGGIVSAYSSNGEIIKLTRMQRGILSKYKSNTYIDDIHKEFGIINGLLDDDFKVIKNDEVVYRMHK